MPAMRLERLANRDRAALIASICAVLDDYRPFAGSLDNKEGLELPVCRNIFLRAAAILPREIYTALLAGF